MKVRNAEGFLFPASQLDFRHDATLYPAGALHGLGALNGSPAFEAAVRAQTAKFNYELKKVSQADWLAAAAGVDYGALSDAELNKAIRIGYEYAVNGQAAGDAMRAAEDQNIQAAAAQQAANAAATAAAQAAAQQAAAAAAAQAQADAVAKAAAATTNAKGVNVDTASVRLILSEPQVIAATNTQKTAVDTTSGTVKTVDTASGATSTANAQTGAVSITLPTGEKFTGVTSVTAGGVTTSVDPKTGAVTTQNTATGVATQTDATTGKTATGVQVTGTPATGGTFMLPDGKTVTTTTSITGGGLNAGKIALVGLVGLLLLRGAIK
jgi:hypothetical protein